MDVKLAVGVLTFFGVIIGATLQYFFTKHVESLKHAKELKSKAYADYLDAISEDASYNHEIGSRAQKRVYAKIADAKARICLYGSSEVITAYSEFLALGGVFNSQKQKDAFTKMFSHMRKDSGGSEILNLQEIEIILLGHPNDDT
ncbi:hypothetical protein [Flocculibacter collagenilyticus]|uniref:hypothetical protein n=1 Tax=Flocculibacter collagenilyticus TaxID=2744479 RepID=UPI0018F3A741|nr:hypothetical protein [Flocculibacter collagenilyticus]